MSSAEICVNFANIVQLHSGGGQEGCGFVSRCFKSLMCTGRDGNVQTPQERPELEPRTFRTTVGPSGRSWSEQN